MILLLIDCFDCNANSKHEIFHCQSQHVFVRHAECLLQCAAWHIFPFECKRTLFKKENRVLIKEYNFKFINFVYFKN